MKVLFVQEKPFLCTALQLTLASKGHDLIFTTDVDNVDSVFADVNPELLIADITLHHGMNYIKEATAKKVPVIVISENGHEDDLQEAFDIGAGDYLTLPFSMQELALRVEILYKMKVNTAA